MAIAHLIMVVPGLLEKSRRKVMDGLRKFIAVDNHAAVKIGDLEKEMGSKKAVNPKFTTDFPGAVVREGADELTLCAHVEEVVRTCVGNRRWEPPHVDEDWHAI